MTKVTTTPDLRKKIRLNQSWLTEDGLGLVYDYDGEEKCFELSPLQAAKLLKKCGLIEDYESGFFGGFPYLTIITEWCLDNSDHNGQHVQHTGKIAEMWSVFVKNYNDGRGLSQYDGLALAIEIQQEINRQEMCEEIMQEKRKMFSRINSF